MKRKLPRNIKMVLSLIPILLICAAVFWLFVLYGNPGSKKENVALYNYSQQDNIAYSVALKPNSLYNSSSLGEGMVYLSPLVDGISATFHYQYKGEREAELKGDYEIFGIAEGYQGVKETYKTLWTKRYVLQAKTSFSDKNKDLALTRQIPIAFNDYRDYAGNLAKDLNLTFNSKLTVYMVVHLQAVTDNGTINETLSPNLVIPLNPPYFEITKNVTGMKTGAIRRTEEIKLPVNKQIVFICGSVIALAAAALIYVLLFTSGTKPQDPAAKRARQIFSKYGNRMVALSDGLPATYGSRYRLNSLEDLIRLSDETGRPVLYEYQEDMKNIKEFSLVDQNVLYSWHLKEDAES